MNQEVEQDHYLGAWGFVTPHCWLQGAKLGPVPSGLQGGGKYVAGSDGTWPWFLPHSVEGELPVAS